MDDADVELRNATYALVVDLGRTPSPREVGATTGRAPDDVLAGWRRLHEAPALVLEAGGRAIRMANPFAALHVDGRIGSFR